jgi:hypothetical protein
MAFSERRPTMRKIVFLAVVFGLVSGAEGEFWLAVNDEVPPGGEITLAPSETVVLSLWGDGTDAHPIMGYILVQGPGSIDGHTMLYPGNLSDYQDGSCDDECPGDFCPATLCVIDPGTLCNIICIEYGICDVRDLSWWVLIDTQIPPRPLLGKLIDDIIFHCDGLEDVVITLVGEEFVPVCDSITIHQQEPQVFEGDYGDCPGPYPTLLADDGARHKVDPNIFLGQLIDKEADGQPSAAADGDDANLVDDEGAITFLSTLEPGYAADVEVSAWAGGQLDAWVDFNGDGDWYDAGEQIFTSFPLEAGKNTLTFNVPAEAAVGPTYARFRLSRAGGLKPTGPAQDGEVEDYRVTIEGCFPSTAEYAKQYARWLEYRNMYGEASVRCWCAAPDGSGYQCLGDADGVTSGFPYNYRVYTGDLNMLINCWKMKMGAPALDPCADVDHKDSGFPYYYPCYTGDLNILIANWKKKDSELGIPGPCPLPD